MTIRQIEEVLQGNQQQISIVGDRVWEEGLRFDKKWKVVEEFNEAIKVKVNRFEQNDQMQRDFVEAQVRLLRNQLDVFQEKVVEIVSKQLGEKGVVEKGDVLGGVVSSGVLKRRREDGKGKSVAQSVTVVGNSLCGNHQTRDAYQPARLTKTEANLYKRNE